MLFPVFVVMTLLEIYVLVSVGSAIGAFPTVFLVIITALIGSSLLKQQGWSTMAKAQKITEQGNTPAFEIMEGLVILISGVMLLTPGFITDAIGLLGLIPFSRRYFINHFLKKNASRFFNKKNYVFIHRKNQMHSDKKQDKKDNTIDGEFWED